MKRITSFLFPLLTGISLYALQACKSTEVDTGSTSSGSSGSSGSSNSSTITTTLSTTASSPGSAVAQIVTLTEAFKATLSSTQLATTQVKSRPDSLFYAANTW